MRHHRSTISLGWPTTNPARFTTTRPRSTTRPSRINTSAGINSTAATTAITATRTTVASTANMTTAAKNQTPLRRGLLFVPPPPPVGWVEQRDTHHPIARRSHDYTQPTPASAKDCSHDRLPPRSHPSSQLVLYPKFGRPPPGVINRTDRSAPRQFSQGHAPTSLANRRHRNPAGSPACPVHPARW